MDPRAKEAAQLEKEAQEIETRLQDDLVQIGRRLAPTRPGSDASATKLRARQEECARLKSEAGLVLETAAQLEASEKTLAELQNQIDKGSKELEGKVGELGAEALKAFRAAPSEEYAPRFAAALEAQEQLEKIEKDLHDNEGEERSRSFFSKLVSRGRQGGLRASIVKQEQTRNERLPELARALLDTGFGERLSGDARTLFDALRRQRADAAALQARIDELSRVQQERRATLRKRCGETEPRAYAREIEKSLAEAEQELDRICRDIGRVFLDRPAADAGPAGPINAARSVRDALESKRRRIAVLRGELEVETLLAREKTLRRKREQIELEIGARRGQAEAIEAEIKRTQKRVRELRQPL